jgi:hypothetical protein
MIFLAYQLKSLLAQQLSCSIALRYQQSLERSMSRDHVAASRPTLCTVCSRPLSFHQQWAGDICDNWRCRWTRLIRQMEAHRQAAAGALGVKQPEVFRPLVVPHRPGVIEDLPAKRRADHLKFLIELVTITAQVRVAGVKPGGDRPRSDGEPREALAAAVCAVCAGACCHRAGDHAFLDAAAIARFPAAIGIMDPSYIADTYAAYLPARSFAGSCVYHTFAGCSLPRALRADICNAYRCSGLKQAEDWACRVGTTHVYVVVREDNRIKRSAFVQPGSIRHYPYGS